MKKYLIIISGWHFLDNGFFESIKRIVEKNNADVLISSHRTKDEINPKILNLIAQIPRCNIQYFENIGFDWGMLSQSVDYLGEKIMQYDYVCFIHDDTEILDETILQAFSNFIEKENLVVAGNCRNVQMYPFRKTHAQVLEWARLSEWKLDIKSEKWSTARGSFVMLSRRLFEKIKKIPYKHGSHSGYGNWGVIIFGGLVADTFGSDALKTISDEDLKSPYLLEYSRGEDIKSQSTKELLYDYDKKIVDLGLRVHLGCGKKNLGGYLNIDGSPQSDADLVMNITKVDFKPGTVKEVLMEHVLEHLTKFEAERLLKTIYDWLRPEGCVIIEGPDVEKVARLIIKNRRDFKQLEEGPYGLRGLYGEPFENMHFADYHKWNYSGYTLRIKLQRIGFKTVCAHRPLSHGRRWKRDLRIIGFKSKQNKSKLIALDYLVLFHQILSSIKVVVKHIIKKINL